MVSIGALNGKSIQCISYITAPWMLGLYTHQMIVNIDFFSILKIVGKDFQDNRASSAVILQEKFA